MRQRCWTGTSSGQFCQIQEICFFKKRKRHDPARPTEYLQYCTVMVFGEKFGNGLGNGKGGKRGHDPKWGDIVSYNNWIRKEACTVFPFLSWCLSLQYQCPMPEAFQRANTSMCSRYTACRAKERQVFMESALAKRTVFVCVALHLHTPPPRWGSIIERSSKIGEAPHVPVPCVIFAICRFKSGFRDGTGGQKHEIVA